MKALAKVAKVCLSFELIGVVNQKDRQRFILAKDLVKLNHAIYKK